MCSREVEQVVKVVVEVAAGRSATVAGVDVVVEEAQRLIEAV